MDQRKATAYAQGLHAARKKLGLPYANVDNQTNMQPRVWVVAFKADNTGVFGEDPFCNSKTACRALAGDLESPNAVWKALPSLAEAIEWRIGFWDEWWQHQPQLPPPGGEPDPEPEE